MSGSHIKLLSETLFVCAPWSVLAGSTGHSASPTNIFDPASTPAQSISGLSLFVLTTVAAIFIVVFSLLAYSVVKFRDRHDDDRSEPPQIYSSNQVELAWTVIPVLIVVGLFLATAHVIASIQNVERSAGSLEVVVIGHQFWWEYRYPDLKIVTANELHVPVSDPAHPTPTFLKLLSADTDHSFWVPRLAGKTDLIPNHPNHLGSIRTKRGSSWGSARSTAERNMPRCCCASTCNRVRSSTAEFANRRNRRTRVQNARLLRTVNAFLNPLHASTAIPYRVRLPTGGLART